MAAAWRASGESRAAFARRHGLDAQRVCRWIGWFADARRDAAAIAFAPVRVIGGDAPLAPRSGTGIEIAVGAAVVRVERDFDDEHLRRVVAALGGGAC